MKLYVASTSGYAGKTLIALALGKIWGAKGQVVGYVKPLGKIPVPATHRKTAERSSSSR